MDKRTKEFRKQYKRAPKTTESRFDHSQQRIVTKQVARCGVLLTRAGVPVFYAHDEGQFAKLSLAEDLKRYAKRCADPTFGVEEAGDEWHDGGLLPANDPASLFTNRRTTTAPHVGGSQSYCEPFGTYALDPFKAAAVQGVANGVHRDSYGYLITLDDMPTWLEDAFAVLKSALPPIVKPMDAALCAHRIAGGDCGAKDALMASFKAQFKTRPLPFGSLFARTLPSLPVVPPAHKPLVVLDIALERWPDFERWVREGTKVAPEEED